MLLPKISINKITNLKGIDKMNLEVRWVEDLSH